MANSAALATSSGVPMSGRVGGTDVVEIVPLPPTERVPRARVDDARRDGVHPNRCEFDREAAGEVVGGSVRDRDPEVADLDLDACTPENNTNDPPGFICGAKCSASIVVPMTLVSNDN